MCAAWSSRPFGVARGPSGGAPAKCNAVDDVRAPRQHAVSLPGQVLRLRIAHFRVRSNRLPISGRTNDPFQVNCFALLLAVFRFHFSKHNKYRGQSKQRRTSSGRPPPGNRRCCFGAPQQSVVDTKLALEIEKKSARIERHERRALDASPNRSPNRGLDLAGARA